MAKQTQTTTRGKGYLPIRLKLPRRNVRTTEDEDGMESFEETYFYIKEHYGVDNKQISGDKKQHSNNTIFVSNAPVVPGVRTRLLLKALFGRFGDVTRVTVVENPRKANSASRAWDTDALSWTTKFSHPSYFRPRTSEGKFAHVVFSSNKEMKRALNALGEVMASSTGDDDDVPGLSLDRIEIQTLADETDRLYQQEQDNDQALDQRDNDRVSHKSNLEVVARRYRESISRLSRDALLQECNSVMEEYEDAEKQAEAAHQAALGKPDEDGFVTVSYSAQVGAKSSLEGGDAGNADVDDQHRRKGQKRKRKKKESIGATELKDFYRFQTKEIRKKSLEELREKFEQDLAKVKRMKEEKQFQPF